MKKAIKKILTFSPNGLYQTFKKSKRRAKCIKDREKKINTYLKSTVIKKMQIGCGSNILEGWLNTDLNYSEKIAFLDAGEKFPIESDKFDFIYSEHLFEHLKIEQQLNMLEESYRVLKNGGIMRIATPSIEFLFNLYAKPKTDVNKHYINWAVNNIPNLKITSNVILDKDEHYCYVINNFFKAWGHQMIHNYNSLSKLALQCGYSQVRQCKIGESEVSFLRNIEKHGTIIPKEINLLETMVVEIIK